MLFPYSYKGSSVTILIIYTKLQILYTFWFFLIDAHLYIASLVEKYYFFNAK